MKLSDYRSRFIAKLKDRYGEEETKSIFLILTEAYLGLNRLQLALQPDLSISRSVIERLNKALDKLEANVPIQQIIGKTEFYGLPIKVSPDVLIPRPETEELVDWIVNDYKNSTNKLEIIDIGTGSGCISIALKSKLNNITVTAIDVSERALELAVKNAELNDLDIAFKKMDILKTLDIGMFDIIVSNPPYVRHLEKSKMDNNVLQHEPHLALFVDDKDPLRFYRAILDFAINNLKSSGCIYLEINEYLGNEMMGLIETYEYKDIILKKDMFGRDRMIKASKL